MTYPFGKPAECENSEQTSLGLPHICVCICTFKRQALLKRLLEALKEQDTSHRFSFSILVVDNDRSESARSIVENFMNASMLPITYVVEPRQNIALARNKAVEHASGDFVAFIDDDEFPIKRWLRTLYETCLKFKVDGVLGPVKPHFDEAPPTWVVKGKFYERPTYQTGLVIDWRKGRTGNVLLRRHVLLGYEQPFRPEFRNGEDQEFFYRAIGKGHVFVWCDEAVAYEAVPPLRWNRKFLLKRALLRGAMEPQTPGFGLRDVAKSFVAVVVYGIGLPFALLAGQDKFMRVLVRLCDHMGKLLAVIGINPVQEQYVTE
ncbi:MAG TPA: glycosyltransferase family 2 protein [Nitrospira sp.]|nr:glycosyltransferase family 2 protein [Nitrospira sp.]